MALTKVKRVNQSALTVLLVTTLASNGTIARHALWVVIQRPLDSGSVRIATQAPIHRPLRRRLVCPAVKALIRTLRVLARVIFVLLELLGRRRSWLYAKIAVLAGILTTRLTLRYSRSA